MEMRMFAWVGGIPLDTWQRSGRATFARMQTSKQESKRGERGMSWMTLIVIEL